MIWPFLSELGKQETHLVEDDGVAAHRPEGAHGAAHTTGHDGLQDTEATQSCQYRCSEASKACVRACKVRLRTLASSKIWFDLSVLKPVLSATAEALRLRAAHARQEIGSQFLCATRSSFIQHEQEDLSSVRSFSPLCMALGMGVRKAQARPGSRITVETLDSILDHPDRPKKHSNAAVRDGYLEASLRLSPSSLVSASSARHPSMCGGTALLLPKYAVTGPRNLHQGPYRRGPALEPTAQKIQGQSGP